MKSELLPKDRLAAVQKRLEAKGVIDVKMTFAPDFEKRPLTELYISVAEFLEAYLDGRSKPIPFDEMGDFFGENEVRAQFNGLVIEPMQGGLVIEDMPGGGLIIETHPGGLVIVEELIPDDEEDRVSCWACGGWGVVTTSSNGSGLIDQPCLACADKRTAE